MRPSFLVTSYALFLGLVACGGNEPPAGGTGPNPAQSGTVNVSVATTGTDQDPDAYTLSLASQTQTTTPNGSASFSQVGAGQHDLAISGIAANCSVNGANPRSVTVTSGQTSNVTVNVTCQTTTGSVQVTTTTVGDDLDPDGYLVSVSGGAAMAIGINASITVNPVSSTGHSVTLQALAANCRVTGANPLTVTVSPGQTVPAAFDVQCDRIQRIVFLRGGNADLFMVDQTGANLTPVTNSGNAAFDAFPSFSPDGSRVVFSRLVFATIRSDVLLINADGSGEVNLTSGFGPADAPNWVSSGSSVVYACGRGGGAHICSMDLGTTIETNVTAGQPAGNDLPVVSPGGTKIAYLVGLSANREIFVMDIDGSNPVNISNDPGPDGDPVWAPDGSRVAFNCGTQICSVNPDGSGLVTLSDGTASDRFPTWSPDGSMLAFVSDRPGPGLYTMMADGSGVAPIVMAIWSSPPAWSPDGRLIAYVDTDWGDQDIWVVEPDGSNPRNVSDGFGFDQTPKWQP